MPFDRAVVSTPGSERMFSLFGEPTRLHATAAQTGGSIGIWESDIPPGRGVGRHRHTREDEVFYVLAGTFRFSCGDEEHVLGQGGRITLPRNVSHAWVNIGDAPGRLLSIVTPGGFEEFFLAAEARGLRPPQDAAALAELEAGFGVPDSAFLPPVTA